MDSVGTKSYRQRSAETLGFEAPAPHIVVVCPSCKTSFAVETAAVAALETPRFHCSRCDDIFVMKDAPADMLPLGGVQVQSITRATSHAGPPSARSRSVLPESLIKSSDFSLGYDPSPSRSLIEHVPAAASEPPPPHRSELSLLNKELEENEHAAEKSEEINWESFFEPPALGKPGKSGEILATQTPAPPVQTTPSPAIPTPSSPLSSRQFVLSDPPPVLGSPTQSPAPQTASKPLQQQSSSPTLKNPHAPGAQLVEAESYRPAPRQSETSAAEISRNSGRFSKRMQSLISMSTPILGTLALLLGVSYCARLSPQSIDALAQVATPSIIQDSSLALPPTALSVKNLSLSFEKTRNKEIVPVARGTVANDSTRSFDDVELEVIGFNARGEIIASSKAPLRSALNNEKIANLPFDAVRRYQSSLSAKSSVIRGQERVPFTIALLNGRHTDSEGEPTDFNPSEVRYFSARIFSIKK